MYGSQSKTGIQRDLATTGASCPGVRADALLPHVDARGDSCANDVARPRRKSASPEPVVCPVKLTLPIAARVCWESY